MKTIIDALEFCKQNELYDKHICIALGINQLPKSIKDGLNKIKMKNKRIELWQMNEK